MTATYRGWLLGFEYGWHTATHPDFDASWEGTEDGWVGSHPTLSGRTLDDLKAEIDAWSEESCLACEGDGLCWNNADPTSGQCVPCPECRPAIEEQGDRT